MEERSVRTKIEEDHSSFKIIHSFYIYLSIYFYVRLNRVAIINNSHCILLPFIIVVLLHVHSILNLVKRIGFIDPLFASFYFIFYGIVRPNCVSFPSLAYYRFVPPFRILTTRLVFTYELSFFYHSHGPYSTPSPSLLSTVPFGLFNRLVITKWTLLPSPFTWRIHNIPSIIRFIRCILQSRLCIYSPIRNWS